MTHEPKRAPLRQSYIARLLALAACAAWLTAGAPDAAAAEALETIPLQYRLAEDLLPVLQPLVPAGAALTGTGDMLLVRGDAATIAQIRAAVAQLDRTPRQLLITVGQATTAQARGTSVRGSGTISAGDVQVGVNQPPQSSSGARVVVRSGTASDALRDVASVQALEGRETYVSLGQSRPFTSTSVTQPGIHPPVISQSTGYRDVQSGFFATPRLNGDRVTLEISSRQQRVTDHRQGSAAARDVVASGSITTVVSGRLGEWIEIGGASAADSSGERGLITWGTRSDLTQYSAWVKVDELH